MLIHLDNSVLVDAFTGSRRALPQVVAATGAGDVLTYCALAEYEWLRGPRSGAEREAVARFFGLESIVAFGMREAEVAAALYRDLPRARQRQADLAIAACAIEHGAQLWTLNPVDFEDIPGLAMYQPAA